MTSSPGSADELRPGKIGDGFAQDLVGLPHLALEPHDLFALFRGGHDFRPRSRLGWRSQLRSVWPAQPSFWEIELIADRWELY